MIHPDIHLEIARQRHRDILARAERHRIASAYDEAATERLCLRQLRASDQEAVTEWFSRLSARSRYQRFAAPKPRLTRTDLDRLIDVDPPRSDALGAFLCGGDRLVGFARYAGGDQPHGPELGAEVLSVYRDYLPAAPRELNGFVAFHSVPPAFETTAYHVRSASTHTST